MTTQSIFPVGGITGTWRGDLHETSRFQALVARLQRRFAAYNLARQTYEALQRLSDRDLHDIATARCDSRTRARDPAEATMRGHASHG